MFANSILLFRRALNRASFVFVLWIAVYLAGALQFSLLEKASLGDGLWWAIVTGTTTGYGDIYPELGSGRVVAGVYMFIMMVLNAFIIAHISIAVFEDKNLFSHTEQEQAEATNVLIAVKLGVFPEGTTKYPSLEWFRERKMEIDDENIS